LKEIPDEHVIISDDEKLMAVFFTQMMSNNVSTIHDERAFFIKIKRVIYMLFLLRLYLYTYTIGVIYFSVLWMPFLSLSPQNEPICEMKATIRTYLSFYYRRMQMKGFRYYFKEKNTRFFTFEYVEDRREDVLLDGRDMADCEFNDDWLFDMVSSIVVCTPKMLSFPSPSADVTKGFEEEEEWGE
jgi:hypothetical protein